MKAVKVKEGEVVVTKGPRLQHNAHTTHPYNALRRINQDQRTGHEQAVHAL